MDMKSKDQRQYNIERFGQLFPEAITEIKDSKGEITRGIDVEAMNILFGDQSQSPLGGGNVMNSPGPGRDLQ